MEFQNPHESGAVRVHFSSVYPPNAAATVNSPAPGYGPISDIVQVQDPRRYNFTHNIAGSWIMVDLGAGRALIPNYYCLRHGYPINAGYQVRNWQLQGRVEGEQNGIALQPAEGNWTVLLNHSNCDSINVNVAAAAWPVQCATAYRYFRILATGLDASNTNYLCMGGLELYGTLINLGV